MPGHMRSPQSPQTCRQGAQQITLDNLCDIQKHHKAKIPDKTAMASMATSIPACSKMSPNHALRAGAQYKKEGLKIKSGT
ncbi:MAG: hypothetical protein C7B43_19915 [Sulfobacillus benefaciens]|uniref:Uncharacterized protein n=1 Tax=Sulfobacillus benefaciens TaxID=453960 RepID=A0A2T2WMV9_9FIRM|nr:MAG: hypothetical protein C7B43_19915 [Sulfobacillus benefaciens]HBQ94990.1 hypothetical protein [Sulfobacillus sp.]